MYNTIKLEKGLYSITGKSFTQALEQLDPDSNYKGTELEGLDAFERQLKRFNIKVSGVNSDKVEKFFLSSESAVLFPEYIRRTIKQGMDEASIINHISAAVSYIDGIDFKSLNVSKNDNPSYVDQLSEFQSHTVKLDTSNRLMTKYGRSLKFSYESIKKQRLEALGVILKRMGAKIAIEIDNFGLASLTGGLTSADIAGTKITYDELAAFFSSMTNCNMSVLVCSPATLAHIVSMPEMKNCQYDYMSSGVVKTPFGVTLVKCIGFGDSTAVGIDKSCAVETVFGSDLIVEYDKLISNQCNEITASITVGFAKLTDNSILTTKIKK